MTDCFDGGHHAGTGIAGIVLFTIVLLVSILAIFRLPLLEKGKWFEPKQNYFWFVAFTCILDVPRYWMMALDDTYTCSSKTWTYSLHLLGNAAFFSSYSIICAMWQDSVGAGKKIFLFTKPVLAFLNVLFLLLCIVGAGLCVTYPTIIAFFTSVFYSIYTIISAGKNVFFFSMIVWSGYSILKPLQEARAHGHDEMLNERFRSIMIKLLSLMVVCAITGTLRFLMLLTKIAILHQKFSGRGYTGPFWWLLSDFIPRIIPTVSFMIIMFGSLLIGRHQHRPSKLISVDKNMEFGSVSESKESMIAFG
ncbi:hypothetical protein AAMO2058_000991900 [Amorphochlora amoebiformis]